MENKTSNRQTSATITSQLRELQANSSPDADPRPPAPSADGGGRGALQLTLTEDPPSAVRASIPPGTHLTRGLPGPTTARMHP